MNTNTIDRLPPEISGDARRDIEELSEYIFYLVERLNYTLAKKGD